MKDNDARAVNGRCQHCGRHLATGLDPKWGRCVVPTCARVGEWQAILPGFHIAREEAARERVSRRLRAGFEV